MSEHATREGDRLCGFLQSVHESGEKLDAADAQMIHTAVAAIEAAALTAERARLRVAVEALHLVEPNEPDHAGPWYDGWHDALDTVARLLADT